MRQLVLAAATCALLAGCAGNPYQPKGMMGGHQVERGPGHLDIVTFTSPGGVSWQMMELYTIYRCAERAREKSMPWFVIYQSFNGAARGRAVKVPIITRDTDTPVATAFMLPLKTARANAYNTEEVLTKMKAVIENGGQR